MATYKISFLGPSRKASSLETRRPTQSKPVQQSTYRKNSRTRRQTFELPTSIHPSTFRKGTLSQSKNKSTQRHLTKVSEQQGLARRPSFKNESLEIKKRFATKLPTARIYTEKQSDKADFASSKSPPKRSYQKTNTQQPRRGHEPPYQFDTFEPITGEDCAYKYAGRLTDFERDEVSKYPMVYFLGFRRYQLPDDKTNFDDEEGEMVIRNYDQVAYRYEVKSSLGKGSFGQVFKAYDHKTRQMVALKVIKNKQKYNTQAKVQIKILNFINQTDKKGSSNVVQIKDSFIFREHTCIVFQLLENNLYEFLKLTGFNGFALDLIRRFTIQILQCLMFMQKYSIVHCDLKPQNILLKHENKSGIKIIDFGSGCFENERIYTYIQSRFYRAPEIILGIEYTTAIDMWSLGCIICELYLGYPIFPGEHQAEQLAMFMEVLGVPPLEMIQKSTRKRKFFNEQTLEAKPTLNSKGKPRRYGSKTVQSVMKCKDKEFCSFVKMCLEWQPSKRLKASQGLLHSWIVNGLPEDIRDQHIAQMKIEAPHLFS